MFCPGRPAMRTDTFRYEFYYDVYLAGKYTFRIADMHAKYGPIVRINPYELHVSDPSYYDTIYASTASGHKRDKWSWCQQQFGTDLSMFSTVDHDLHRQRRQALSPFFSTQSVMRLQPLISERVGVLVERFKEFRCDVDEMRPPIIDVQHAFAAFSNGRFFWQLSCCLWSSLSVTVAPHRRVLAVARYCVCRRRMAADCFQTL